MELPHLSLVNLLPRVTWTVAPGKSAPTNAAALCHGWTTDLASRTLYNHEGKVRKPRVLSRRLLLETFGDLPVPTDGMIVLEEAGSSRQWCLQNLNRSALLRWVQTHGLLGTLLHRYASVDFGGSGFVRLPQGWVPSSNCITAKYGNRGEITAGDPAEWRKHLSAATHADPPRPGSESFWQSYGEPLQAIIDCAMQLKGAIQALAGDGLELPLGEEITTRAELDAAVWAKHRTHLSTLLATGVSFVVAGAKSGMFQQIRCHSLLGALSMMLYTDVTKRVKSWLVQCQMCGTISRRDNRYAKYCSDQCRNNAYVTRSQSRKQESSEVNQS